MTRGNPGFRENLDSDSEEVRLGPGVEQLGDSDGPLARKRRPRSSKNLALAVSVTCNLTITAPFSNVGHPPPGTRRAGGGGGGGGGILPCH